MGRNIKIVKENKKTMHPNSRKAKKLNKQFHRDLKMEKNRSHRNIKLQILGDKLFWFKNNMDLDKEYTPADVAELIHQYIDRNKEELEQIKLKQTIGNRKRNQHASRESTIEIVHQQEMSQFNESGFETVDLFDKKTVTAFKNWSGEIRHLSNIKLRKYKKSVLENCSSIKTVPVQAKSEEVEEIEGGEDTSEEEEEEQEQAEAMDM